MFHLSFQKLSLFIWNSLSGWLMAMLCRVLVKVRLEEPTKSIQAVAHLPSQSFIAFYFTFLFLCNSMMISFGFLEATSVLFLQCHVKNENGQNIISQKGLQKCFSPHNDHIFTLQINVSSKWNFLHEKFKLQNIKRNLE